MRDETRCDATLTLPWCLRDFASRQGCCRRRTSEPLSCSSLTVCVRACVRAAAASKAALSLAQPTLLVCVHTRGVRCIQAR